MTNQEIATQLALGALKIQIQLRWHDSYRRYIGWVVINKNLKLRIPTWLEMKYPIANFRKYVLDWLKTKYCR